MKGKKPAPHNAVGVLTKKIKKWDMSDSILRIPISSLFYQVIKSNSTCYMAKEIVIKPQGINFGVLPFYCICFRSIC